MRSRLIILILWLGGLLLPLGVVGRLLPPVDRFLDALFAPEWVHVFMHTLLYCGLVILLFFVFGWKMGKRAVLMALLAVLVVGVLQEILQAIHRGAWPLLGILADLGVDLAGGAIGLGLIRLWAGRTHQSQPSINQ